MMITLSSLWIGDHLVLDHRALALVNTRRVVVILAQRSASDITSDSETGNACMATYNPPFVVPAPLCVT